jgi:hypothetical protein
MKYIGNESTLARAALYLMLLGLVAAALLLIEKEFVSAQTKGSGAKQGRSSRYGELQSDPKPQPKATGRQMEPVPYGAVSSGAARIQPPPSGDTKTMEAELALSPQAVSGNKQPDFNAKVAERPGQGAGPQKGQDRRTPSAASHLHLVLEISDTGSVEVLSAVEVSGDAILSDEPAGDFVYEVRVGERTVAVQALPDPFEMRSFPGPEGTPQQGHNLERAKKATIVVKVPRMTATSALLNTVAVRLYKIKPSAQIDKINTSVLQKLRQDKKLEMRFNITSSQLGPQIREKVRKLPPE